MMDLGSIIPYGSVFIDAHIKDFRQAFACCFVLKNSDVKTRLSQIEQLKRIFNTPSNQNHVLPCLCVRAGFDLFLRVKQFPAGSEIIMSAINIPDMRTIAVKHGLSVVSADLNPNTLSVDPDVLEQLITEHSVAILIAHIYGKWCDVEPLLLVARKHGLYFIEDCAEGFWGFNYLGHPEADLSIFSFGVIKVYTCFSGAMIKIRDEDLFVEMQALQLTYPIQTRTEYAYKLLKYLFCFLCINGTCITKLGMQLTRMLGLDHQKFIVHFLRGFTNDVVSQVRKQPSTALLANLALRLRNFDLQDYRFGQEKMQYVTKRLPEGMKCLGQESFINNHWLFPVVVENPEETTKLLRQLGVDAYKGCTQLNVIYPSYPESADENDVALKCHNKTSCTETDVDARIPVQAKYLIDHIIYLPVHKLVPYKDLDKLCLVFHITMAKQKLDEMEGLNRKLVSKL